MSKKRTSGLPHRLEAVRQRFERWRKTRKGHARIPEPLWAAAVKVAGAYGLHRSARALGLDYMCLKRRLEAASSRRESSSETAPTFVEMIPARSAPGSECLVELEHRGGSKMRIHLKSAGASELRALGELFWMKQR